VVTRYQELHDALDGVSYKVLTDTLRRAEHDGLISRHLDPKRVEPPRFTSSPISAGPSTIRFKLWSAGSRCTGGRSRWPTNTGTTAAGMADQKVAPSLVTVRAHPSSQLSLKCPFARCIRWKGSFGGSIAQASPRHRVTHCSFAVRPSGRCGGAVGCPTAAVAAAPLSC